MNFSPKFSIPLTLWLLALVTSCSPSSKSNLLNGNAAQSFPSGNNVVPVAFTSINRPTVSVTICVPGTNQCQLVPNVLLDSGSDGLRIFSSAAPSALPQVANQSGDVVGFCATFGGGQSAWGPYKYADVILNADRASRVPVQIIDSAFAVVPGDCSGALSAPADFGNLNGIMGIGLGARVAGSRPPAGNGFYTCQGANCTLCGGSSWASCGQDFPSTPADFNPVAFMLTDNNGWFLQTPDPGPTGTTALAAALVLGLGTQVNNAVPATVKVFPIDADGFIPVQFQGQTYNAVLDTGTVGWLFPKELAGVPTCGATGVAAQLYCPPGPLNFQATFLSASSGGSQATISLQIQNPAPLLGGIAKTLGEIPCTESFCQNVFIMGAPFFMGRTAYYGIRGAATPVGIGPFNAF